MFSPWQLENTPKKYRPVEKLLMTQNDKFNYIVKGRMLDFCLEQGMELIKIHKKLVYRKSYWLKEYIEFNQFEKIKVQDAKYWFRGDFFKLHQVCFWERGHAEERR